MSSRVEKADAHTDWMNECVPQLMDYGKDQLTAVAACMNMWRDAWEESHPDGAVDPGPSPKPANPDSPLQQAADQKELRLVRAREMLRRAEPRTLYVHRKLLNRDAVIAWAKAQGFATTLDHDLHVTIAFSKRPLDWGKLSPDGESITVPADDERSVEQLGDEGAVVLRFESPELQDDWQRYVDAGAAWDYPSYKPHVTITYEGGDVDLTQVRPYDGELQFGPEIIDEIADDIEIEERAFNEADHPRDEHGRWTDGGGGDESGGSAKGTKADMERRYGKPSAEWKHTASGKNTKEEQRLESDNNFIRSNKETSLFVLPAGETINAVPYYSEYVKTDEDHSHWNNFITTPKGIASATLMTGVGEAVPTLEIAHLQAMDRGSGRAALEMLTKAADQHGTHLKLDAVPLEPSPGSEGVKMTKADLEAFYAGFGFKQEGERDEGGKGTITMVRAPSTDASASAPAPTPAGGIDRDVGPLFVSETPNQPTLDRWHSEMTARSEELAAAGQAGNDEDDQIGRMQTALNNYSQESPDNLKNETAGLNAVYDGDTKLQAAAFSFVRNKIATIQNFGAVNHAAGVKVLQQVVAKYAKQSDQVEGDIWEGDTATRAMYEEAGYAQRGEPSGGGRITMVKTDLPGGGISKSRATQQLKAEQVAVKLDFKPSHIQYTEEDRDFELAGQKYKYAGSYQHGEPTIKLYMKHLNEDSIKGVTAHEIGHRKFEMLRTQLKLENEMLKQDPGPPPDPNHRYWWGKKGGSDAIMAPDGTLRAPYDTKYPTVHEWAQIGNMRPSLEQDDGITDYSKAYWSEWEKGKMSTDTAYHETMAEMSRNLGVMGKHSAVTGKGWRQLYDLQERVWSKSPEWMRDMSMNRTAPKAIFIMDDVRWELR